MYITSVYEYVDGKIICGKGAWYGQIQEWETAAEWEMAAPAAWKSLFKTIKKGYLRKG